MLSAVLQPILLATTAGLAPAPQAGIGPAEVPQRMRQAESVAADLSTHRLTFTMRGTSVNANATIVPRGDGCTAIAAGHAPGSSRVFERELRWADLAWVGTEPGGRTTFAFFDAEGRLPADVITFNPADGKRFRAELADLAAGCRDARAGDERIALDPEGIPRSCYFARWPALQLIEGSPALAEPARAMLTVLSRENPQGELQVLAAPPGSDRPGADNAAKGGMDVTFTFADDRVRDMRIVGASFLVDGAPVDLSHSVAVYGDTRLRVMLGSSDPSARGDLARLTGWIAEGRAITMRLLDSAGKHQVNLTFDVGKAWNAARVALDAVRWSCTAATPPPAAANLWRPAAYSASESASRWKRAQSGRFSR